MAATVHTLPGQSDPNPQMPIRDHLIPPLPAGTVPTRPLLLASILRTHFLNREDRLAIQLPGPRKTPCPVNLPSDGSVLDVLLSHTGGLTRGVPSPALTYETKAGTGRISAPHRLGSYCPDKDGLTRWTCIDLDGGKHHAERLADPRRAACEIAQVAGMLGIGVLIERSGSGLGWHVWVLFDEAVPAALARQLALSIVPGSVLLEGGKRAVPGIPPIEVFPKVERVRPESADGWTGSMVWLPWWSEAKPGCCVLYRLASSDANSGAHVGADPDGRLQGPGRPVEGVGACIVLETWEPASVDQIRPVLVPKDRAVEALAFLRETAGDAIDPAGSAPALAGNPRVIRPRTASAPMLEWRRQVLAAVDLDRLFPGLLTGRTQRRSWLECRDPRSASGDASRSAGVADGTGSAARGTWHSFRDGASYSALDWLIFRGVARDFPAACRILSEWTGIRQPDPEWLVEARNQAEEGREADRLERAGRDEDEGPGGEPEGMDEPPDFGDGTGEQPGDGMELDGDQPEESEDEAQADREDTPNVIEIPKQDGPHWITKLTYRQAGKQTLVVPNLHNTILILSNHADWKGVIGFDDFKQRPVMRRCPPSHRKEHAPTEPLQSWQDSDDVLATAWLQQCQWELNVAKGTVNDAIPEVAKLRHGHPIRAWLDSLKWDGKPRLDRWLTTYLGVPDSFYSQAVGARWLISAVARVFKPGCKVDCVLILEGKQSLRKSMAIEKLTGRQWFTDHLDKVGTKDAAMQLSGIWIIEIAELDSIKGAAFSQTKAFITRTIDRFRCPYGHKVQDFPRQCVFAATTNESAYLEDPTGGRRFWPVCPSKIDIAGIERDRAQIWAEARMRYEAGSLWYLDTPELEAAAYDQQESRFQLDEWEPRIADFIERCRAVTVGRILQDCLVVPPEKWDKGPQARVGHCLHRLGWVRKRIQRQDPEWSMVAADTPGQSAGRVWIYVREADAGIQAENV